MSEKETVTTEYLNSLPEKTIHIAGKASRVRVDTSNNIIYLLDNNGKYTGKFTKFAQSTTAGNSAVKAAPAVPMELSKEYGQAPEPVKSDDEPTDVLVNESTNRKRPRLTPTGVALTIVTFICVLTILSGITAGLRQNSLNNASESTGSSSATTESPTSDTPAIPPEQAGSTNSITLLSPSKDIFPGDPLSKVKLNPVSISATEYQSLSVTMRPYLESDAAYLPTAVASKPLRMRRRTAIFTSTKPVCAYPPISPTPWRIAVPYCLF